MSTTTIDLPAGCAERAALRALAVETSIAAPGCTRGLQLDLGTLTRGGGLSGRYTRGEAEGWYSTAQHLERVSAGWELREVRQ